MRKSEEKTNCFVPHYKDITCPECQPPGTEPVMCFCAKFHNIKIGEAFHCPQCGYKTEVEGSL